MSRNEEGRLVSFEGEKTGQKKKTNAGIKVDT